MKKLLISFIFILISSFSYSQSFNETIDYINDKLRNECYDSENYVTTSPFDGSYYQFEVTEKGLLKIKYYWSNGTYVHHTDAYLKSILLVNEIEHSPFGYYFIHFNSENDNCFTEIDVREGARSVEIKDTTYLTCDPNEIVKKVHNAIKHLLELANKNEQFLEKDPFSD